MQKSEAINELATALSKAQSEIRGALKDSTNPFFKSNYADLTSVIEAIKVPFAKHGLAVSQLTDFIEGVTVVETVIMHSSGQWISGTMPVKVKDDSPQALGSGISYSRRYALQAAAGVPSLDDDAQAAQGHRVQPAGVARETNDYVFEFGKYKGMSIKDVGYNDALNYLNFMKRTNIEKGVEDGPRVKEVQAAIIKAFPSTT